jgi:myo-inositol-1(or 4)-monophosphatase
MITRIRDIRRFGAAAIDLCFVASGRYDAYFEEHLHSWDLVAGHIIATEAGAIVTNYSGAQVTPAQVLASSPGVHAALVALIAETTTAAP